MDYTKQPEQWLPVIGYEEFYQISNYGRLKSTHFRKELIMKPGHCFREGKPHYVRTILSLNGVKTNFSIHRLVAMHFVPNPENLPEVNHDDLDTFNNYYKNLSWVTKQQNFDHYKLNRKIYRFNGVPVTISLVDQFNVSEMRRYGMSISKIASLFEVNDMQIRTILFSGQSRF